MNTVSNLESIFFSRSNIRKAIKSAAKDKKKYNHVQKVLNNIEYYIDYLEELLKGDFKVRREDYIPLIVHSSDKERLIEKLPFFPFRVVQHMIANVLLKRWNKYITDDTYASWKKRGINSKHKRWNINHKLKRAICSYKKSQTVYCLKIDIKKCYQSVDNKLLSALMRKFVRNKKILAILDEFIFSIEGLPIGSYLSQLLINLFLSLFDRFVKEVLKVKHYFRYMDDIVILCESKEQLHEWEHKIIDYFKNELHFVLSKRQIFPVSFTKRHPKGRGIDYVGYVFYRTFTNLRKRIKVNFKRRIDKPKSVASYYGLAMHCNAVNLLNKTIGKEKCKEFEENRMSKINKLKFRRIKVKFRGAKIDIKDVVNRKIDVTEWEIRPSTKQKGTFYLKMEFRMNGKTRLIIGAYKLLMEFLEQFEDKRNLLPFEDMVIKYKRFGYYFQGTLEGEEEYDEFDDMDRNTLKKFISDNKLNISVKKSMTDDDIRDLIRNAVDEEEEDEDEIDDEEE